MKETRAAVYVRIGIWVRAHKLFYRVHCVHRAQLYRERALHCARTQITDTITHMFKAIHGFLFKQREAVWFRFIYTSQDKTRQETSVTIVKNVQIYILAERLRWNFRKQNAQYSSRYGHDMIMPVDRFKCLHYAYSAPWFHTAKCRSLKYRNISMRKREYGNTGKAHFVRERC